MKETSNQSGRIPKELTELFGIEGQIKSVEQISRGHIHDTFAVTYLNSGATTTYIQQRLNNAVFQNLDILMTNIERVLSHIERSRLHDSTLSNLEVPSLVRTSEGQLYAKDSVGKYWRTMTYISSTRCFDVCSNSTIAFEAGRISGLFERALDSLDVDQLEESIPRFRDLPYRYKQFDAARQSASPKLLESADSIVKDIEKLRPHAGLLQAAIEAGKIPIRPTHNDLKLNNILFEEDSFKARALIDFDTCMPGNLPFDFGNLAVFCCVTAKEDESDLTRIDFDLEMFKAMTRGFLEPLRELLSGDELKLLAAAPMLFALNDGIRFTTDYLQGNIYFKIDYPGHNLVRAKSRIQLAMNLLKDSEAISRIIESV